jgi:hypothetical protein
MRLHLFQDTSTGELQVTRFLIAEDGSRKGKTVHVLQAGQRYSQHAYEELWRLGNGSHDVEDPIGKPTAETVSGKREDA